MQACSAAETVRRRQVRCRFRGIYGPQKTLVARVEYRRRDLPCDDLGAIVRSYCSASSSSGPPAWGTFARPQNSKFGKKKRQPMAHEVTMDVSTKFVLHKDVTVDVK